MESSRYHNKTIIPITPKIEDLVPHKRIQCPEPKCLHIFSNIGNLQMHLTRHHKINKNPKLQSMKNLNEEPNSLKLYFCPVDDCIYNENVKNGGRSFANIKYVRQHYQKVHIAKTFQCSKCEKSFGTNGQQKAHEVNCGKIYQCGSCECKYTTKEALLTHIKRKKHLVLKDVERIKLNEEKPNVPKIELPPFKKVKCYQKSIINENSFDQKNYITFLQPDATEFSTISNLITTTLPSNTPYFYLIKVEKDQLQTDVNATRTTFLSEQITENTKNSTSNKIIESNIRSQTEVKNDEINNVDFYTKNNEINHDINSNLQIFKNEISNSPYLPQTENDKNDKNDERQQNNENFSRFYEDSCFDELVNSSNFCDIETQTEFPSELDQLLYSNMHTQTCDDFLQELGLADIETQTNWSAISDNHINHLNDNNNNALSTGPHDDLLVSTETQTSFTQCLLECSNNNNNNSNSSGLNGITQHTQTCDTLLDGLFGGQDFIGSFQSTHTQT